MIVVFATAAAAAAAADGPLCQDMTKGYSDVRFWPS